jgi:hypothetical protein
MLHVGPDRVCPASHRGVRERLCVRVSVGRVCGVYVGVWTSMLIKYGLPSDQRVQRIK